jgi:phosphoglycerate kinase
MRSIEKLELKNKRVLIRADLNVPVDNGKVSDDFRIRASLPTIRLCLENGAKVAVMSHLGRPKGKDPVYSLKPVAKRLGELLGMPVRFVPETVGEAVAREFGSLEPGKEVLVLENVRFEPGEEKNDEHLSRAYAQLCDVFVNDAFASSHRAHASVAGVARFAKEKAAGLLLIREVMSLKGVLEDPKRPLSVVLGGAKVSTKIGVIENLLKKADRLLIGGAMANTFLKALGHDLGKSLVEDEMLKKALEVLEASKGSGCTLLLPCDAGVGEGPDVPHATYVPIGMIPKEVQALDIGPASVQLFKEGLEGSMTVLWNGPMGMFEKPSFALGTYGVAFAVSQAGAFRVAGGGETDEAIERLGLASTFSFISTAGGAFLEFLEGKALPGIAALEG